MSAPEQVAAGIWRLPFDSGTLPPFDHTNGWLVVSGGVAALIDPGFRSDAGMSMLATAAQRSGTRTLKAVLLTHTHVDHRQGLPSVMKTYPDAMVYVHPLERDKLPDPQRTTPLQGGRRLTVGDVVVRAHHTPGHSPGHLCFELEDAGWLLAGDLVAGSGSVWVGVPEGDVKAYLDSIERMRALGLARLAPGHGEPVVDAQRALVQAREHRLARERQVLAALDDTLSLGELRARVYPDLAGDLVDLAERSLLAHLAKLMRELRVVHLGDGPDGPYRARA